MTKDELKLKKEIEKLKREFYQEMKKLYGDMRRKANHDARWFSKMLKDKKDGVWLAKFLIDREEASDTYKKLKDLKMLDLTAEAVILRKKNGKSYLNRVFLQKLVEG